ncbi:UNVERIFIED_CONTAM: hypothetical protein FKN15_059521 [Acipenser sinensis]
MIAGSSLEIGAYDIERGREAKCEPIEIPMCQGIGYNMTRMPNYMRHENQKEAAIKLHEFAPLVEYGCHVHLRFFLCSLYAPMCTDQVSTSIPACRPMCEQARQKCAIQCTETRNCSPSETDTRTVLHSCERQQSF